MTGSPGRRRLRRSRDERLLFGVCGALAEYLDIDPTIVRIATVLLALFPPTSAVAILGYILLTVMLPDEAGEHLAGRERLRHNLEELRTEVGNLTETVRGRVTGVTSGSRRPVSEADGSRRPVSEADGSRHPVSEADGSSAPGGTPPPPAEAPIHQTGTDR